jgi:hypothetical protein
MRRAAGSGTRPRFAASLEPKEVRRVLGGRGGRAGVDPFFGNESSRGALLRPQMLRPAFSQYGARSLRLKILPESSRGSDALSATTFGTL